MGRIRPQGLVRMPIREMLCVFVVCLPLSSLSLGLEKRGEHGLAKVLLLENVFPQSCSSRTRQVACTSGRRCAASTSAGIGQRGIF